MRFTYEYVLSTAAAAMEHTPRAVQCPGLTRQLLYSCTRYYNHYSCTELATVYSSTQVQQSHYYYRNSPVQMCIDLVRSGFECAARNQAAHSEKRAQRSAIYAAGRRPQLPHVPQRSTLHSPHNGHGFGVTAAQPPSRAHLGVLKKKCM